jgi:hypothetical protein
MNYFIYQSRATIKEEIDTMAASCIEPKDINGTIARRAREFWVAKINETVGI